MKAITLNLLVEEQLAQKAKARDPVKVTIVIGIVLVTLAVMVGSWLAGVSVKRKNSADAVQSKLDALTVQQVGGEGVDTKTLKAMSDEYVTISKSRHLFAQDLALIKDLVPPTIQINNLRIAIMTETPLGPNGKVKPTERIVLQIDGRAICPRAEIEVDRFIQAMQTNEISRAVIGDVKLRSISHSSGDAATAATAAGMPSASFVIDCAFKGKDPS